MSLEDIASVVETLVGRAYAAIRLIDGTTHEPLPMALELRDLQAHTRDAAHLPLPPPMVINKPGLIGFFYPDDIGAYPGRPPSDALDLPSSHVAAEVSGVVADPSRRYNATAFVVSLAAVTPGFTPAEIAVFRTPFGTPITRTGAVVGNLRYDAATTSPPARFARMSLTFTVTRRLSDPPRTILIEAETDSAGDFVLPLDRLPALTGTETGRLGSLAARAPARDATVVVSGVAPLHVAHLRASGGGATTDKLSLHVRPGAVLRVPELPARHLVAVPT